MKKYFVGLLFTCLVTFSYSLTLDEMITDIRIKIGDAKTDVNNQRLSSSTIVNRINIVMQDEIAPATLCLQARISTPTITNQREYSYNADVIAPFRLAYYIKDSNPPAYKRLEWYTIAALDRENDGKWENSTADLPTKYYERGKKYGLSVRPSSVYVSTYAVQIDYYKRPDALTTGGDVPFDNDTSLYEYHYLIMKGVVILCKEDEGVDTSAMKTEYWSLVSKMKADLTSRKDTGIWK